MQAAELKETIKNQIDTADDILLHDIESLLNSYTMNDSWDKSSPELQNKILTGIQQAENGNVIEHEVVMKKYLEWKGK